MSGRLLPNAVATSWMTNVRTKKSKASSVQPRKPASTALRWLTRCSRVITLEGRGAAVAIRTSGHIIAAASHESSTSTGAHGLRGRAPVQGRSRAQAGRPRTAGAQRARAGCGCARRRLRRSTRRRLRAVHPRVVEKLQREPVEDYRIDFEDGFGHRPDDEEDRTAEAAAGEVAAGMAGRTLPPAHRHPDQAAHRAAGRARPPHARSVHVGARDEERGRDPVTVRRHAAESDRRRATSRHWQTRATRASGRTGWRQDRSRFEVMVETPQRALRAGRPPRAAVAGRRGSGTGDGRALRAVRLHRRVPDHGRAPGHPASRHATSRVR